MSLTRFAYGLALVAALAGPAAAQSGFVPEEDDAAEDADETSYEGSLTSTTFGHRETAPASPEPITGGLVPPENASRVNRFFTDIRGVVDAEHIGGGKWDVHADARVRQLLSRTETGLQDGSVDPAFETDENIPVQSGTFDGGEYEVRELYVRRRGKNTDAYVGRQIVLDIAATKIDGLRIVHRGSRRWEYIGFAGMYPQRGSRSVLDDYPCTIPEDPDTPEQEACQRARPVAVGAGGAYRYESIYGAIGAGGVLPLGNDIRTGTLEKNRVFVTSNGYWRQSAKLDVYHYVVVDLDSSRGFAAPNVTLGANFHPTFTFRLFAQLTHIDTETLNIHAQTRLEDIEDPIAAGYIPNNVEVMRVAQDEARAGASLALAQSRFEIGLTGRLRRRPAITVGTSDGMTFTFDEAQDADVTVRIVDRRFFWNTRLAATATAIFGVGDRNLSKSTSRMARLSANRPFKEGEMELELDLAFLQSSDEDREACAAINPVTCYGQADVLSLSAGALLFYRWSPEWFLIGSAHVARQTVSIENLGARVAQPAALLTTGFLRVSYRF